MPEHRINMTAAEIRAYQAGERTIKRKMKPQPDIQYGNSSLWYPDAYDNTDVWCFWGQRGTIVHNKCGNPFFHSPFGQPGDPLVFLEKWASPTPHHKQGGKVAYDADGVCGCWFGSAEDRLFICHGRVHQASGYHECFPKEAATTRGMADYTDIRSGEYPSYKYGWRASQTMPRWAARYTPTVRTVRVEQIDGVWWWVAEVEDAA